MRILEHVKITINHEKCPFSKLNEILDLSEIKFENFSNKFKECNVYFNENCKIEDVNKISNVDVLEFYNDSLKIKCKDSIFNEILDCGIIQGINLYKKGDVEDISIEEIYTCSMESFLCSTQNTEELYFEINKYNSDYLMIEKIDNPKHINKFINSEYNIFPGKRGLI